MFIKSNEKIGKRISIFLSPSPPPVLPLPLPPSLSLTLPPSLLPSLPPFLSSSSSLPLYLPSSLPPSFLPSLPLSVPVSLPLPLRLYFYKPQLCLFNEPIPDIRFKLRPHPGREKSFIGEIVWSSWYRTNCSRQNTSKRTTVLAVLRSWCWNMQDK